MYIMIKNIVISGGGTKCICFLGVLSVLDKNKILSNIDTYIGTSMGAIISTLLAIGYTWNDLYDFMLSFNMKKLLPDFSLDELLSNYGIDNGEKSIFVIKELIKAKTNQDITFLDIYKQFNKKLYITASCISDNKIYYYNYKDNPDMIVWYAIKKSFSIPGIFQPVFDDNKYFVDGGLFDNYPIQLKNIKETIGITIIDREFNNNYKINNVFEYFMTIAKCCINNNIEQKIKKFINNTIPINTAKFDVLNFSLSKTKIIEMFKYGEKQAEKFMKTFKYNNDHVVLSDYDILVLLSNRLDD